MDAAAKMLHIVKMWMLHTHVQPSSTEDLYSQRSYKVGQEQ